MDGWMRRVQPVDSLDVTAGLTLPDVFLGLYNVDEEPVAFSVFEAMHPHALIKVAFKHNVTKIKVLGERLCVGILGARIGVFGRLRMYCWWWWRYRNRWDAHWRALAAFIVPARHPSFAKPAPVPSSRRLLP
jgi:hypothetical protein